MALTIKSCVTLIEEIYSLIICWGEERGGLGCLLIFLFLGKSLICYTIGLVECQVATEKVQYDTILNCMEPGIHPEPPIPPEPAETRERLHDTVVGRIINRDCLDTMGRIWKDLDDNEAVNLNHIPPVFLKPLGQYLGSDENFALLQEKYPKFTAEEQREIIETSRKNAVFFAQQGDQRRAVEAQRVEGIFIEWVFKGGEIGLTEDWGTQEINGKKISALRTGYIKGTATNLQEYLDFVQAVEETDDAKESARNAIKRFNTLQELGTPTYAEALSRIGMDASLVDASAQAAEEDFKSIKEELGAKIAALVEGGVIPQDDRVINSYAAYSLAATLLDQENTLPQNLSAQEIFTQFAQTENVSVPDGSVLVLSGVDLRASQPRTSTLAWIDESGESTVGAVMLLPEGTRNSIITHESAHALSTLIVGNELGFPLLAVAQASKKNEMAGTYGGCKANGGNSYFSRLEALRFALLNQAQLRKVEALDAACQEKNEEEVARILKEDLTSPEIERTFGKAVKGEGRGAFIGVFGVYASANSDVMEKVKDGITLRQLVIETSGLPAQAA